MQVLGEWDLLTTVALQGVHSTSVRVLAASVAAMPHVQLEDLQGLLAQAVLGALQWEVPAVPDHPRPYCTIAGLREWIRCTAYVNCSEYCSGEGG